MSSDSESFLEKYTRKYGVLKTLEEYINGSQPLKQLLND